MLGQTVVTNLFGAADPLGVSIHVQQVPCQVVGVPVVTGQSPMGQDQDDVVLMPFPVVQRQLKGITWLDDILCSAVSPEAIPLAEAQMTALLHERHRARPGQEDDFNLRHPAEIAEAGLDHGVGHFRPLNITRHRHLLTYHGTAMSHEGLCQVF